MYSFPWCQNVCFTILVSKCPSAKLPGAKLSLFLSWCQIVRFYYLGAKVPNRLVLNRPTTLSVACDVSIYLSLLKNANCCRHHHICLCSGILIAVIMRNGNLNHMCQMHTDLRFFSDYFLTWNASSPTKYEIWHFLYLVHWPFSLLV